MDAYLLKTGRVILPFDRPVGEMKIHTRPLRESQQEILRALGCTPKPIDDLQEVGRPPCLLIYDDLYFTYHAMAGFLKAVGRGQTATPRGESAAETEAAKRPNARAALAVSPLTERFLPALQGTEVEAADGTPYRAYDCYFLREFDPQRPPAEQAQLVPVPHKVKRIWSRANRYFEPSGKFTIPVSRVYMAPIRHWASMVSANLLGMPGFFLNTLRQRRAAAVGLAAKVFWRAGSLRPGWLLGKLYLAGRKCRIHPSAHIEAAVLGRRVRIGPNAVIRGSVIGDETEIGPGALVEACSLGSRVTVDGGVLMRCCVVDDEANMGALFNQFSVIGQGAVMCPDSGIVDYAFRGSVKVPFEGSPVGSGSRLLGGCLGDRVFLGPGVKLMCGREVPNDCVLIESPRILVRDVEQGLPRNILRIDRRRRGGA